MNKENNFLDLIKQLEIAAKECWNAKVLVHDMQNKYAPLCVQIMVAGMQIPPLINNCIENRKVKTGLDPVHPDFWDADMIIALHEYFESCPALQEELNASA